MLDNPALRYTGIARLAKRLALPSDKVKRNLAKELQMDRMKIIGQLTLKGNVPCLTCGHGDDCEMSGVPFLHGKNAKATAKNCVKVENQKQVWNKLQQLGKQLANQLTSKTGN